MNNGNKFTAEELESIWKEMLAKDDKKPTRLDRSAWEPCGNCRSCENCKYSLKETCLNPCYKCLIENAENHVLPFFEPVAFCKFCGRPLKNTAWDMLEKRLDGESNGN